MAVAYTINSQDRTGRGKQVTNADIAYTTEAYSSGLPVSGASLGCPNVIESLMVVDQGGAFAARYNGGKIRLYQQDGSTAGAGPLTELSGNQTLTLKVIAIGW